MSTLVWETEWRIAVARRRLFALNVVVPLLLVAPIALSKAPTPHAAAVYAVLFVIHGTFGSAIPLLRAAESGMLARVLRGGVPPGTYLLQRCAAASLLDWIQLLPSALVSCGGLGVPLSAVPWALAALLLALWIANALGACVGALARSMAEAALFAAVTALLLLHASGVFRSGAPGTPAARVEAAAPFRALHETLLGGGPSAGFGAALAWGAAGAVTLLVLGPVAGRWLTGTALRG